VKIRNYERGENMRSRSDTGGMLLKVQRITSVCGSQIVMDRKLAILVCIIWMVGLGLHIKEMEEREHFKLVRQCE